MDSQEKREHRRVSILLSCIAGLLLVVLIVSIFYIRSTRPMRQARNEAIALAEKYTDLKEVDNFYWFTRESSSFSLTGKDNKGQPIVVLLPKSGEKIKVYSQEDGLTEDQVKQQINEKHPQETIQKANLGIYHDEPTWEVMTKNQQGDLQYYLVHFKDGKEVGVINNI